MNLDNFLSNLLLTDKDFQYQRSNFFKMEKRSGLEIFWDQFSLTSSENSDVESFCPHDGHLPL